MYSFNTKLYKIINISIFKDIVTYFIISFAETQLRSTFYRKSKNSKIHFRSIGKEEDFVIKGKIQFGLCVRAKGK